MRIEHAVTLLRPAAEVFPWLFDEDKVPRWTSGLEAYEKLDAGPLAVGTRIRESLVVSGQRLSFELEVIALDVPNTAESRFATKGFEARQHFSLAGSDGQTTLTQAIEAKVGSFSARLLAPIIEPRLQEKLERDHAALRALLVP